MGQFMPEDVQDNRPRQAEKHDQPKDCAEREEPKFLARPKPMHHGRTCEHREKCLTENCADWQQKNRTDKLYPACRHSKRIRRGNASCRPRDIADNLSAAVAFTRPAIGCRSSIRRSQSHPQITQIAMNLEKRNRDESQNREARGWFGFSRGSARGPRAGEGGPASRTFRATSMTLLMTSFRTRNRRLSRRAAETNRPAACAP